MNCGCEYCTDNLCELENLLKTNKNIVDVSIHRSVEVTITAKYDLTEQERDEIYYLEGKAIDTLSIDGLNFRCKTAPDLNAQKFRHKWTRLPDDYYQQKSNPSCSQCSSLLTKGAQPENLGIQACGCSWQINEEQSIVYKRK